MRFLMIFALMCTLLGCNLAEKAKAVFDKQKVVASSIEKQCGKKPEVGFEYTNGALISVEVIFYQLPETPLKDLYALVSTAVVEGFQDTPKFFKVSFSVDAEGN